MHLSLERINQNAQSLQAQIGAGVSLGPISEVASLVELEASVAHTKEKIIDLRVDPKYPEAVHALHLAYLGNFSPLQTLAAGADKKYLGVRNSDQANVQEETHDREFQFLTFDKESEVSESTVNTHFDAPKEGSDKVLVDRMTKHRNTSWTQRSLDVNIRTLEVMENPLNTRSLSVKLTFHANDAEPDELRQFLDLARILAPDSSQDQVKQWINQLNTDHPTQSRGDMRAYFYIAFDPSAVVSLLKIPDQDKSSQMLINWAKALNLSNPESWGKMTTQEQDAAAAKIPGLTDHLTELRRFASAILKSVATQDAVGQARTFVQTLRGSNYDLYPIAALAWPSDRTHLLSLERVTLTNGKNADTLEFNSIGDNYVFPPKTLY
jgi:hypothetical protein